MLTQQAKLFFPPSLKKKSAHTISTLRSMPKECAILKSWSFLSAVLLWVISFAMMRVALTIH